MPRLPLTTTAVVFQGICNPPEQIKEGTFRLTATNRMNLQRLLLPEVRIQRSCPWNFPCTPAQQQEAVSGGGDMQHVLQVLRAGTGAEAAVEQRL